MNLQENLPENSVKMTGENNKLIPYLFVDLHYPAFSETS